MHLSAFKICKFLKILPLLLILLLDLFYYGFWMYRKDGHTEATFVEFYIDVTSSFHVNLKLESTARSNTPYPINHEQPKCCIVTESDQIGFSFV
jgi:hypothetical protein